MAKTKVEIETDFAAVTVLAKDDSNEEFLIRHALHQLLKKYTKQFGDSATESVMNELAGYHKSTSPVYQAVELRMDVKPAQSGTKVIPAEEFERRRVEIEEARSRGSRDS
jgi:hypothetical protein